VQSLVDQLLERAANSSLELVQSLVARFLEEAAHPSFEVA
jgi:hypothetical protein